MSTNELPGQRLARWRAEHWPPKGLTQYGELPIYYGDHDAVAAFGETLAEAMLAAAPHIYDECRGATPRWMHVPKLFHDVERVNLAQAVAKASRRFGAVTALVAKCGAFGDAEVERLGVWLAGGESRELVAHRPFVDLRAYIFCRGQSRPARTRYYESGLVLAVREGFLIQDHRAAVRRQRADASASPLATNAAGWVVFGR